MPGRYLRPETAPDRSSRAGRAIRSAAPERCPVGSVPPAASPDNPSVERPRRPRQRQAHCPTLRRRGTAALNQHRQQGQPTAAHEHHGTGDSGLLGSIGPFREVGHRLGDPDPRLRPRREIARLRGAPVRPEPGATTTEELETARALEVSMVNRQEIARRPPIRPKNRQDALRG